MLFLQGTRDVLADLKQLEPLVKALDQRGTLKLFEDADHSFHLPEKSGRKDAEVRSEMLDDPAGDIVLAQLCQAAVGTKLRDYIQGGNSWHGLPL